MDYRLSQELKTAIEHELHQATAKAGPPRLGPPGVGSRVARAEVLVELNQAVYDFVKEWHPGGEGLDGNDGPERAALGKILDEAKFYLEDLGLKQAEESR